MPGSTPGYSERLLGQGQERAMVTREGGDGLSFHSLLSFLLLNTSLLLEQIYRQGPEKPRPKNQDQGAQAFHFQPQASVSPPEFPWISAEILPIRRGPGPHVWG